MFVRHIFSGFFAASLVAVTLSAHAQTPTSSQQKQINEAQERFTAADKNADGKLTLEEAKAGMPRIASNFNAIDTNKDGFVTLEEIKVMILR
ncbi:EF-hand domain-containing protein [Zwartia vadi]|uniref:EF-hand domain-containing protein n=1 Tax=Zwartia vadi TaxID=3058168 RepID=UPI0025B47A22|nr:EF-hand domain-containing protein [Zwartia vadi]MDN3986138.1 EF-hand domain-containing protein [Zwartia vadi]